MADWLQNLVGELAGLPGVAEVAVADESGGYVAGQHNVAPDEFAAIIAFTARSALAAGEILALDGLRCVSLVGKKHKMLVFNVYPYAVGVRLAEDAILSRLETRIEDLLPTDRDAD